MARDAAGFDKTVPLPSGLTIAHIRNAIEHVEEQAREFIDVYYEQANIFSALIGIFGVRALHAVSPYKRHKHPDVAQQQFPDLSLDGRLNPPPKRALESKGSTRPWEIQSHYNHEGWYIVWRYMLDPTKKIKKGKPIVVWRVDIPYLKKGNWIYQGSKAAEGTGGRTHTFGVRKASTVVRPCVVYHAPNVQLYRSKPNLADTAEE